jgi:hypothetical protein
MSNEEKLIVWCAIDKAERNGYSLLPNVVSDHIDGQIQFKVGNQKLTIVWDQKHWGGAGSGPQIRTHQTTRNINDILFDQGFAVALWGAEDTYNGVPMLVLKLYLKQVAVKVGEKIIAARSGDRHIETYTPDIDYNNPSIAEISMKKIVYKLEDMYYTIPIDTHQLTDVSFMGTEPAYQHHLKQLVTAPNKYKYLAENM